MSGYLEGEVERDAGCEECVAESAEFVGGAE